MNIENTREPIETDKMQEDDKKLNNIIDDIQLEDDNFKDVKDDDECEVKDVIEKINTQDIFTECKYNYEILHFNFDNRISYYNKRN